MAGDSSEGSEGSERELSQTSTWAVASVCGVIILISIILEKSIHKVGEYFTQRRKKALFEALEKVKSELMTVGFISLLLSFGQNYIAKICIPHNSANIMLPCELKKEKVTKEEKSHDKGDRRRLLWDQIFESLSSQRRALSDDAAIDKPAKKKCSGGTVSLLSVEALHQLHIFIFFLAVIHVFNSALTMALGRLKIRGWKEWEKETSSLDYEFSNDPARFRFAHETSFVRSHTSFWTKSLFSFYIVSFFRQFFRSVRKADYLTMRHGFIAVHLAPGSKFDFQKYIKRSLEDDFKVVVGISPLLWASAVVFLLLNVKGWQALFWVSTIPPIIILAVGTKLQAIITRMALEIKERHAVIQGIPLVQLGDKHFWFGHPKLVLFLIHFSLFQNAFQITYFLWIWFEFGLESCFNDNFRLVVARIVLGVGVQFMCSYITLPLYALVSQMGSQMKKSIFDDHTTKALKKWRMDVKRKKRGGHSPSITLGQSTSVTPNESPAHALHRYKTTGHMHGGISIPSRSYYSDQDLSDADDSGSPSRATLIAKTENREVVEDSLPIQEHHNEDEFSFAKLSPMVEKRN